MKELAENIKRYRSKKGFSQAELATRSGLSLRTIQRIESGETIPHGDSLQRLSNALEVTPNNLIDWELIEDKNFLLGLNLSSLFFILFPLLGVFVPLVMWLSRKDQIQKVNLLAKHILNFQLTWVIILFIGFLIYLIMLATSFDNMMHHDMTPTGISEIIKSKMLFFYIYSALLYLYNIVSIWVNTRRISKGKFVCYWPTIRFMKTNR